MTKKSIILTILLLSWCSISLAAAPDISQVSYNANTNILRIDFTGNIFTSAAMFNIGGLSFDDDNGGDNPDVAMTGGVILNTSAQNTFIEIDLIYEGNIGTYTDDLGVVHYTWGMVYNPVEQLEGMENKSYLKLKVRELTYIGVNYDANEDIGYGEIPAPPVNYSDDTNLPHLIYSLYDAATNNLIVAFDRDMQWDATEEDLMYFWIDTLGLEHRDPGNGVLNVGEDRNFNGVLDFEQNVTLTDIMISDASGASIVFSSGLVVDHADNDTLEIELILDDYKGVENLDPASLAISFPAYTFTDTYYNPVEAADEFPVAYQADGDPCEVDSVDYNMGTNELKVFFSNNLSTDYYQVPKFSFTIDTTTVVLQSASSTPVLSASGNIKIVLLSSDQMAVEALINSHPGSTVYLNADEYAVLDNLGNGNEISNNVACHITPESGNNKAPEIDSVAYYAETSILEVVFDVGLKITEDYVIIEGFSLVNNGDTLTFANSVLSSGNPNNKTIWIAVDPIDELGIESVIDKNAFILLLDAFSVYQNPKLNGNWAVTAANAIPVTYHFDTTSPLPDYVKYNSSLEQIVMHFNEAMSLNVDWSKFTFAGLNLTGIDAEYGTDPSYLMLNLTSGDIAQIEGLSDADKVEVGINILPGAFVNADGMDIDLPFTSFKDNDTLTSGTETAVPLVGIGRDFWLISKEAFPTVDRIIPATIRKIGAHSVIYVADDQWRPYNEVEMPDDVYETNHNTVPLTTEEVDIIYNHFEGTPTVEGAYGNINGVFAVGKADKIPETVNILLCDIRDEYSLGRNDSKDSFWIGSFFNDNDQYSEWEAQGEFDTNELDLIYVDTWPQLYSDADSSWYWYESGTTLEWRLNLPEGHPANPSYTETFIPVTAKNAVDNAYTKLLCYKVDPWESQWMVEGFASLSEFLFEGEASFYGAGDPTTPTSDAIKNFSTGLKTRIDFFNSYLFVLYMYEKYGGLDLIKELAVQPSVDMGSIDIAFDLLLNQGIGTPAMQELWANHSSEDVFSNYAAACLLDTSNSSFAVTDPTITDDERMFSFDNVNLQGVISTKNATVMKWSETSGPPPYYLNQQPWSFSYYYSTFAPGAGLTNPMIAETTPLGNTVSMVDTAKINVLTPFSALNFYQLCLKNEAVSTINDPHFYFNYAPYMENFGSVSFPVSPNPDWTFYHYEETTSGIQSAGDYKTLVVVGVLGGSGKITKEALPPALVQLSVAQNPLAPGRFDIYLLVSDLVWGDGSIGSDVPQLWYALAPDTNGSYAPMTPYVFQGAFGYTDDFSFYNTFINFNAQGNYSISVLFSDLSGDQYELGPTVYAVDHFEPGSGASVGIEGASCQLDGNAYGQPLYLTMQKVGSNAEAEEEQSFLYNSIMFEAPPVVERTVVGPAYNVEPSVMLNEPAWVTLPYGDYIGSFSPSELGIYLYHDEQWVYLGGQPDPSTQTIKVRAKQLGLLQIQSGPHPATPVELAVPTLYKLEQNYPNPFNPTTTINYQLPRSGKTTLRVYDITGREAAELVNGFQGTGFYSVRWDGSSSSGIPVASGVYFYRLESGNFNKTSKMIFLK